MRGFDVFGNVRSAVARLAWMGALVVASTACDSNPTPHPANDAYGSETRGDVATPGTDDQTDGVRNDCGVAHDEACETVTNPDADAAPSADGRDGESDGDDGDGHDGEDAGPSDDAR